MGRQTNNPGKAGHAEIGRPKIEPVRVGRPRAFNEAAALDAAMRVFWEKGYEGTTLDDLTRAMGINRSSLYASFGDKETLFRRVIDQYASGPGAFVQESLRQPTARSVVEAILHGAVKLMADRTHPRGCLSLQGGLACSSGAEAVKQAMIAWRRRGESEIYKRMKRARAEGDLASGVNPKDLARYISVVMNGLGVQAANGATPAEMTRAVEMALRSMPV